jgi:diguanylate cyclase (GGDEF)-like protein
VSRQPTSPSRLTVNAATPRLRAVAALDDRIDHVGLDGGLEILTRSFAEQIAAETALLVVWDEEEGVARPKASWGLRPEVVTLAVRRGEGTAGGLLEASRAAVHSLDPEGGDPIADGQNGTRITSVVGAPVLSPSGTAGALCAGFSRRPAAERGLLLWTAESHAAVAALCLDGSGLLGALMEAGRRDHLTGCLNYGALQDAIGREIGRCERHGRKLACCFIDLDGFKVVNDTRGHLNGNRTLAAVASALRAGVRGSDLVGRYGGDEFVVVLTETDRAVALVLAQRLRTEIGLATAAVAGGPVAASVGVAEWTPGSSSDALLDRADQALRIAKKAGGGVIAAPGAPETPHKRSHRQAPTPRRAPRSSDGSHLLLAIRRLLARGADPR